jgi:hypothetical protein
MTISEACSMVVNLTRELSYARRELLAYRLMAFRLAGRARLLWCEREQVEERYHQALAENRRLREQLLADRQEAA